MSLIDTPTDKDVLCGRGKPIQHHPGNRSFLKLVEVQRESYQNAPTRADKRRITLKVIQQVRDAGGRFLQLDPKTGKYYDVGDEVARDKVSHALRSRKVSDSSPKMTKKTEMNNGGCSAEQQAAIHQGLLLGAQQRIFLDMVSNEKEEYHDDDDEDEDMDVGSNAGTTRVNREEPAYVPSASCPPGDAKQKAAFDELLRRQQLIFRNLVITDAQGGSDERMMGAASFGLSNK